MTDVDLLKASTVAWVDEKLREMLAAPRAWGGTEALEPLVLVLLMARRRLQVPTACDSDLTRSYQKFLASVVGPGAARLVDRLPIQGREAKMVEILGEFVEHARAGGAGGC